MKTQKFLLLAACFFMLSSFVNPQRTLSGVQSVKAGKAALSKKVSWHYVGYFTDDASDSFDVLVDNDDPTIIVWVRYHGTTTLYTASGTYDPDNDIVEYCESAANLFPPAVDVPLSH